MDELDTLASEWRRLDDDLTVVRWRTERLIGKGCPPATAVRIAA